MEFAFELDAVVVDKFTLAMGFAVVEISHIQNFIVFKAPFTLLDTVGELAFISGLDSVSKFIMVQEGLYGLAVR